MRRQLTIFLLLAATSLLFSRRVWMDSRDEAGTQHADLPLADPSQPEEEVQDVEFQLELELVSETLKISSLTCGTHFLEARCASSFGLPLVVRRLLSPRPPPATCSGRYLVIS